MSNPFAEFDEKIAASTARINQVYAKRNARKKKQETTQKSKNRVLPKPVRVTVSPSYTNPITLSPAKKGKAFMIVNSKTKRKNYYSSPTLRKLIGMNLNNYAILVADPKKPLFKNPYTRGPVYPRNIQRVLI